MKPGMTARRGVRTQQMRLDERLTFVIRGLVPRIALRRAQCAPKRDGRNKSGHDAVGLRAGMTKNETRRVRRKWPSQNSDSIVKQPAPAARQAPSPVLFDRGPGQAGLSFALAKARGMEHREAHQHILRALGARRASGETHAPRGAPPAAFLSPAPCFPGAYLTGFLTRKSGAASAARRRYQRPAIEGSRS